MFTKEFFDLQFSWAERVGAVSGTALEQALFEFTNFYVRFGCGREFDRGHAGWQAYLRGLRTAADGREWTYRFYLDNAEANTRPRVVATFGCFSYALEHGNIVRLHFRNLDPEESSPLGAAQRARRRSELSALFTRLKSTAGEDLVVKGISWLYNLDAYRRLFPTGYSATRKPVRDRFQSMSLWGQFLDHRGHVRRAVKQRFLDSLSVQLSPVRLDDCFPLQVLAVQAPVQMFYEFYGV